MSKDMSLEEKYQWVNKVATNAMKHLKDSAFGVYQRALAIETYDKDLFQELSNPKVGDLVLEITSYSMNRNEFNNIGTLKEIKDNGDYVIKTLDGDTVPWTNAKMIKVITYA